MKKVLMILFASALIYSCGNSGEGEKKSDAPKAADTTPVTPPPGGAGAVANEKALELIGANDCMTCHAIDRKVIGPAYTEVAKKYENTDAVVDTLITKIQKGGQGNWGTIPMLPHPNLSHDDAKEMVKYILSLKNQ